MQQSKRYTVAAVPHGWITAYTMADGTLCAVSDHFTRESAEANAQRLNRHWEALQDRPHQRARRVCDLIDSYDRKRAVRYFPDDGLEYA